MPKETKPTPEQKAALIDHEAQLTGETDPRNVKFSDGRTVAEHQAAAEQVNNDWYADWLKAKAARAKARETASQPPAGQQQQGEGSKSPAK